MKLDFEHQSLSSLFPVSGCVCHLYASGRVVALINLPSGLKQVACSGRVPSVKLLALPWLSFCTRARSVLLGPWRGFPALLAEGLGCGRGEWEVKRETAVLTRQGCLECAPLLVFREKITHDYFLP